MEEKKAGSWAWPGFLCGLALIVALYTYACYGPQWWEAILVLASGMLGAVAVANLWAYVNDLRTAELGERQRALAITADSRVFEEARGLAAQSPELAAELAKRFGRPDLILIPHRMGKKAQIKLAGSDVTFEFVLDALNKSSDLYYAAQRNYAEGTYHYDSNHEITDRQQWKQLNWILARDTICTRYVEGQATNQSPMWVPPWTPERVRNDWLLPVYLANVLRPWVLEVEDKNQAEA